MRSKLSDIGIQGQRKLNSGSFHIFKWTRNCLASKFEENIYWVILFCRMIIQEGEEGTTDTFGG